MLDESKKKVVQHKINSNPHAGIKKPPYSYILADKRLLELGDVIDFSLYYHDRPKHMSLFLQSGSKIDERQKHKLEDIQQIYVPVTDKEKYENYIEGHIQNILKNETLSLDDKTDIIYASSKELTHSLYTNPEALENAQHSQKIVTPILESIIHNENTMLSYMKIIEYDYYTHTHSLNVSIYSLCLGSAMGMKKEQLNNLGRAALLHDLGKSKIDYTVVNKKGSLSEVEFAKMKEHPTLGYEIAIKLGIDNKDILDGIRHHHEKLNGEGYPDKLKNDEITQFARIISVCDVFDALTTKRSYKPAMSSFDALYLMKTYMQTHLDMSILNALIKILHS